MDKKKLKQVILVTSDEKSLNYKWENNAESIKGISVLSEEFDLPVLKNKIKFIGLNEGKEQLFLQSPCDKNIFIEISKSEDYIFKDKIKNYKRIAFLLGAKSFSAKAEFVEELKQTMDADGTVESKIAELNIKISTSLSEKFSKTYELASKFVTCENFDRKRGYHEARALVELKGLENELDLISLIENRNPDDQNKEEIQKVKLELSSELNSMLETTFNLTAMKGVFKLGGQYGSTCESIKKIVLSTEVVF